MARPRSKPPEADSLETIAILQSRGYDAPRIAALLRVSLATYYRLARSLAPLKAIADSYLPRA